MSTPARPWVGAGGADRVAVGARTSDSFSAVLAGDRPAEPLGAGLAGARSSQRQAEMEDQDAVIEKELTWKFSSCPPVEQISKP